MLINSMSQDAGCLVTKFHRAGASEPSAGKVLLPGGCLLFCFKLASPSPLRKQLTKGLLSWLPHLQSPDTS